MHGVVLADTKRGSLVAVGQGSDRAIRQTATKKDVE